MMVSTVLAKDSSEGVMNMMDQEEDGGLEASPEAPGGWRTSIP